MSRLLLAFAAPLLALLTSATGVAHAADPEAPRQYEHINPPQPTQTPAKVEVVELFWYGCPHCYDLEPYLARWLQTKPEHVAFVRMPAVFSANKLWQLHAQAFYTAEALGVLERIHPAMFEAVQKTRRPLSTPEELKAFFKDQGVAEDAFAKAWDSFSVQARLRQAMTLTQRYGIDGVPAIVVNGKYRTSGSLTGSYPNLIKVMESLVDQEHKAMPAAASTKDGAS
jgi:thiol:disulfide interchange protein DsbA